MYRTRVNLLSRLEVQKVSKFKHSLREQILETPEFHKHFQTCILVENADPAQGILVYNATPSEDGVVLWHCYMAYFSYCSVARYASLMI